LFIVALALLLIAMGTYRAPAVALMPDVTPKALRSKGNAIINLMGALGGVFTLGVTGFLVQKGMDNRNDYTQLFLAVAILMAKAAKQRNGQNGAVGFPLPFTRPSKKPRAHFGFRLFVVHGLQCRNHRLYEVCKRALGL
ncbi:MAG: hypothetical protein RR975_12820, partial [Clostridia bacterium]